MEIYEALNANLLAKPGLTALVGDRIFPDIADEGIKMPYVVYQNISDVKDHLLTGQSVLERPVFQYTVYAATKKEASAVAAQIKIALSDYSGVMSGITVQYIRLLNELSSFYASNNDNEPLRAYTHDLEYEVNYERS